MQALRCRSLFSSLCCAAVLISALARGDDDLAKELPRIPPTEPAAALRTFKIHAGFHLDPIAVEPLVTDPVAAVYDADGALYVVEMRGYPYPEKTPSGKVVRLEDANGDGVFDRRAVFLDGLSWPTGVLPSNGGVFVAVAPDILFAKDTNGDGVADVKQVMFTGFGTENVQGLVNGLQWGPDGWVYGASGGSTPGEIKNSLHPEAKPVSIRGRDFRFKPDGSAFEAISGGGQFGHTFDDWGHRFVCNNSNHIRQIVLPAAAIERNPALIVPSVITDIAVEGPAAPVFRMSPPEPWRVVRTRQRAADPEMRQRLPETELHAAGFFTSATGITIYRGSAFPPEFRGNAFIGDVGGNLVHRKTLAPNGSIFKATRADAGTEFLASTDNWFRPVNFANTPNGTLLVLDMYRETIEHPLSIPEPIKKHLDLTSGHDRGRLYEIVPDGFKRRAKPALSKATSELLVKTLADADAWWRETAQRLLIERGDKSVIPSVRELSRKAPSAEGRMHAHWTLAALGASSKDDLIFACEDPDSRVLEAAIQVYAGLLVADVGAQEAGRRKRLIARLAAEPDQMVRFQLALALGAKATTEIEKDIVMSGLVYVLGLPPAPDHWTFLAAMTSASGRARRLLLTLLETGFPSGAGDPPWLDELAALAGSEAGAAGLEEALEFAARRRLGDSLTQTITLGYANGMARSGHSVRDLLGYRRVDEVFKRAAESIGSDKDLSSKLAAIRLVALGPADAAIEKLPPLLNSDHAPAVQLAALAALSSVPDSRVGPALVEHWSSLSPALRREAAEALAARADRIDALLGALESKQIAAAELDPARRKQLLAHANGAIRERAAKLFGGDAKSDRGGVIESYRPALGLAGDSKKGQAVYKQHCATCHRAEQFGVAVGPDLATVANRAADDLLLHILDPNREVAPTYVNYSVATKDGRIMTGIIAEENANAVSLRRAEGAGDVVPRGQIESMASSGISLMPEGLEKSIGVESMADLIAYLRALK